MSKMSSLEKVVSNLLSQANLSYEREKIFKDCYNGHYRYDFYLPEKNALVEVNGEQHYTFTKKFYKNKSEFLKAQERDRRKISYALAQGMKIYCIPYWEISNLHSVDDIFNQKFLAKTKFHNDDVFRTQQNRRQS